MEGMEISDEVLDNKRVDHLKSVHENAVSSECLKEISLNSNGDGKQKQKENVSNVSEGNTKPDHEKVKLSKCLPKVVHTLNVHEKREELKCQTIITNSNW